jgi:hypothetical protein
VDQYGTETDDELKRRVFAERYVERYGAMIAGMREGLTSDAWKQNSRFIGYNVDGPASLGRWGGWRWHSSVTEDGSLAAGSAWEGGIPSYYDNHWELQKAI